MLAQWGLREHGWVGLDDALQFADVVDDGLTPSIDVDPGSVTNTVLSRGDVDHVSAVAGCGDAVVRLLVGDDDEAVVVRHLIVHGGERCTQVGSEVLLAGLHRVA